MAYWNGDIPWVSPKDMKAERIVGAEESITEAGLQNSASNLLLPGRVLMVVRSGILKHTIPVGINDTAVALNQDMKALDFHTGKCLSDFFLRWVQGFNDQLLLAWAKQGATVESIEHGYLADTIIPLPDVSEQTRIVAFLDRETAKIDALVAEQQRLIDLLKEKRQAVISHAVTKGLNPAAPMKPSGIEWLGDVPAHWRVLKGSLIGTLFGSEQIPEELVRDEGDLPFIKVGSMSSESFEIESWDWYVDRSIASQCNPRCDFIVFPKRGAAIFMNKVNLVDRPSLIDPNLMGWAIGDQANPLFIAHALKTRKLDELADVSTVPQINNKHIAPERFPIPPMQEQLEIVKTLGVETEKIDALTAEVQRAIDLLQERRTALISAAVTGQIDVRHLDEAPVATVSEMETVGAGHQP
jgi:type I restriction enzyme S subunit